MNTYSIQEAKENLSRLVEEISQNRQHVRVISNEGNVVILPEETYENLLITLELLSTPGLMDQIKKPFIEECTVHKDASQYFLEF